MVSYLANKCRHICHYCYINGGIVGSRDECDQRKDVILLVAAHYRATLFLNCFDSCDEEEEEILATVCFQRLSIQQTLFFNDCR